MSAVPQVPLDRPAAPTPNFAAIPSELTQRNQWVLWCYELKDGRWTKVLKRTSGHNASSTNPDTWTTFANVMRVYMAQPGKFDGIGFVASTSDATVLIDLDHVLDPESGEVAPWARAILDTAEREGAYIEQSPSGTGFHVIGHGEQFDKGEKRNDVELYCHGRFFTITGLGVRHDPHVPLGQLTETVQLVRDRLQKIEKPKVPEMPAKRSPIGDSFDDALLDKARRAKHGPKFRALFDAGDTSDYPSSSEADMALASMIAFWTGPDHAAVERLMRRSGLVRDKWDTRRGESTYLAETIEKAITGRTEYHTPRQSKRRRDNSAGPSGISTTGVQIADFHAYMPMHQYIFAPSGEMWPGSSVNARLPDQKGEDGKDVKASQWLDKHRPVEQMTWYPGEPQVITDRLISNGGWIERPGCQCFNLYRPPQIPLGDPTQAGPWVEHVHRIYPGDAEHLIRWFAHRRQFPAEKVNHAIVLGGAQGIGKDTMLEPVKHAIGQWNFSEVSPPHLLGRFNGFVKSVILRVSEARDLGDVDRYAFYDHMKIYTAAPPDVLRCDEKHLREHAVPNVCGVIITTNHKSDGLYLPADDRRHYVAWSELSREEFEPDYWSRLYRWYERGGHQHVAAYLQSLDLSAFDPKAPPSKTPAFYDIVDANRAPEDAELADVLDLLGNPPAITLDMLAEQSRHARESFHEWLADRRNRRQIPHRLEAAGYVAVRNDARETGLWVIHGKRQAVYARNTLSVRDRYQAATALGRAS